MQVDIMERKGDPELQSLDLCLKNKMFFSVQYLTGNLISKDFFFIGVRCPYLNFQ